MEKLDWSKDRGAALAREAGRLVAARSAAGEFSGVVTLRHEGETIFESAVGQAALAWRVPITPGTRFRLASVGKMFTATAILQLVHAGSLGLEDRVIPRLGLSETRLPEEVTVRHLLTMTSGIADWFDETGDWLAEWEAVCRVVPAEHLRRNRDYLPLFVNKDPLGPPGERHQYNGAGYILLGLLIEQVTGHDYFEHVRERVFAPAGMTRSDFIAIDDPAEDVAEGYAPVDEGVPSPLWKRNIYGTTPAAAADGGAVSTVEDLCRFSAALRQGRLIPNDLVREMLRPQVVERDEPVRGLRSGYGYGAFLLSQGETVVRWGHTGEEAGVSCRFYHYPGPGIDLVVLGNRSWCAGGLTWDLHEALVNPAGR